MSNSNSQVPNRYRMNRLLLALLLPGLLGSLWLAGNRFKAEHHDRAVELTLDYDQLQSLALSSGTPVAELLTQFKAAGITGIAVTEDTLGDLAQQGEIRFGEGLTGPSQTTVIRTNIPVSERLFTELQSRLPASMMQVQDVPVGPQRPPAHIVTVHATPSVLSGIGIGLPPEAVIAVQGTGLDVVARLQNDPTETEKSINASLSELKQQGITRLVFSGEEVLGYSGLIKYAAQQMESDGMVYGSVEFGKQKGDDKMSEALKSDIVRVHSIPTAEMDTMSPPSMVERFSRAVKERNIRMCYLRLPELVGDQPVANSLQFVSQVRDQIDKAGFQMGLAHSFEAVKRPRALLLLIALSIAAGLMLLLESLVTMRSGVKYGLLAAAFVVLAGLAMAGEKGAQLLALASALVFPTLGITALIGPHFNADAWPKPALGKTAVLFLGCSVLSLAGALLIIGALAERSYMVEVNQFLGIKAAHGLPMLAVVLAMIAGLPILNKPFSQVKLEMCANIRKFVSSPLFVWEVIAFVLAVGIVGFALLRTGNDPGLGVSALELKLRAVLDKIMIVRPRTKEFLIGHPALFLGIACLLTRRRAWGLCLVALGVLGQVSLVNTFCHIHSPLVLSVVRATNGLWLGLLIGWVLWRLIPSFRDTVPPAG